jgi:hypothetical protein
MKRAMLLSCTLLVSCAVSPETTKKKEIEAAFLHYKNEPVSWSSDVEVLAYQTTKAQDNTSNPPIGYKETGYFVAYDPDPYCVDWYSAFEKCESGVCEYKFENTGGFCE